MPHTHSQSSKSTGAGSLSLSSEKRDWFAVVDLSDLVRKFVDQIDYEVVDLGYDVKKIINTFDSNQYPPTDSPNALAKYASDLMGDGSVNDWDDALLVADYTLNTLFPGIRRTIRNLGFIRAKVVEGTLELTGRNRKLHCTVMMLVA